MTRLRFGVAVGVLAATGTAMAAVTVTETGKIANAPKSSVSAKIVAVGGKARKIGSFVFTGVPARCDGGLAPVDARLSMKLVVDPVTNAFEGRKEITTGAGGFVAVQGKVAADARSARGTVSFDISNPPPDGECRVTGKHWKIKGP
ncbi:MAG: hypothetical protein ACJ762_05615 [Solirubrobacteraceae bacterium]